VSELSGECKRDATYCASNVSILSDTFSDCFMIQPLVGGAVLICLDWFPKRGHLISWPRVVQYDL